MISANEALEIVCSTAEPAREIYCSIEDSVGKILAQDILSDRDMPPFDRVAMDGIAVDFDVFSKSMQAKIENIQFAGQEVKTLENKQNCIEIMTGASLPKGSNTIIRYEDLDQKSNCFYLKPNTLIKKYQNIHKQGIDCKAEQVILKKGHQIKINDIAVLASFGYHKIKTYQNPNIAIITTGDELVDIEATPLPHQIRKSNAYALAAECKKLNIEYKLYHLSDDKISIVNQLDTIINSFDIIFLSGGVSKGKKDLLPTALEQLNVKKLFHGVKQKPGKPFWFGKKDKTIVFAFPGNPASTYINYHQYFIKWLFSSYCFTIDNSIQVKLLNDVKSNPNLRQYLITKLEFKNGSIYGDVLANNGSGDFINLAKADGYIIIPEGSEIIENNTVVNFIPFSKIV